MNKPSLKNRFFQTAEEKGRLFEALENDEELFRETLEVMLNLIVSDPKLTFDTADLIERDFRNLYLVIMKKIGVERSKPGAMACCKD